jgi:D-arabinose 1-dehydrogenase-like Zn-dependent alcohol dehydrogenase
MRAVVQRTTGTPEVLTLEEVDKPRPRSHQVLVRIAACGVCFHDVVVRNGTMKAGVEMPLIPGHEICGVVEEVGDEVTLVKPGDRVATTQRYHVCGACRFCRGGLEPLCAQRRFLGDHGMVGGYAEYVAIDHDNVVRVPDGVGDEQAAIAACAIGTALNAVRDVGRVTLNDRVLVTGAGGGVGVHAVQLARRAGAYVIAQTTSADKAGLLESLGAHVALVSARGEDFSKRVKALTDAEGVDVVIDCVGTVAFDAMRRSLGVNGRWILVGQLTGDFVPFNPAQLFLRNQSMLSVHSTTRQQLKDVLDLVARGDVKPVIDGVHPLDDIRDVHARVERGGVTGRMVVRPGGA